MRAKAIAAALTFGVVAVLTLPGGAAAAPVRHYRQSARTTVFLTLPGSHGFDLVGFLVSGRGMALSASRNLPGGRSESVNYSDIDRHASTGDLVGRSLDLRLGHLGHFRGRFVPRSTKAQQVERGCKGEPTLEEQGVFVGSFDFHGERGYTEVHASRAYGAVLRTGAVRCVARAEPRHPGREKARRDREAKEREGEFRLLAGDEDGTVVQADRRVGRGTEAASVTVSASSYETIGGLGIGRSVSVVAPRRSASSVLAIPNPAEPLTEATLQPPAPFSGSATFHLEDPEAASWTGDLAVSLPGAAPLPLTGDGIAAGACQDASNCTETLPSLLQLQLEESGGLGTFGFVATSVATPPAKGSR